MAAYGVDTLDPAVTPRRVAVLVRRLPPWARNPGDQWGTEAHLLANLIDQVAALTYITLKAAGAKNVARPRPVRRPPAGAAQQRTARSAPSAAARPQGSKAGSWLEAAEMLAGIAGVEVAG